MGRHYFHLHLISDSTGETLIATSRAVAAQYQDVSSIEHVYPLVRSRAQLDRAIAEIEAAPGIVLFTMVDQDLSQRLEEACREFGSPCLSVLQPILALFGSYLGATSTPKPGAQHVLNAEYFKRIDALNYTMMHDDGQMLEGYEDADVLLLGVSRTSKTPTSIYSGQSRRPHGQHPAGSRRAACRRVSKACAIPSWWGSWRRRSGSCRSGRTVSCRSMPPIGKPLTSTASRWPRSSRNRAASSPATAGRRSM